MIKDTSILESNVSTEHHGDPPDVNAMEENSRLGAGNVDNMSDVAGVPLPLEQPTSLC